MQRREHKHNFLSEIEGMLTWQLANSVHFVCIGQVRFSCEPKTYAHMFFTDTIGGLRALRLHWSGPFQL